MVLYDSKLVVYHVSVFILHGDTCHSGVPGPKKSPHMPKIAVLVTIKVHIFHEVLLALRHAKQLIFCV